MRRLVALAAVALLAACAEAPVVVGSKEPTQDRILGEMFALLLEDADIRVERRIGLGDSGENFEALRQEAIDLYPEYLGNAVNLVGAPPTTDPDAALASVRAAFAELGLVFLEPLGFESDYAVVVRRELVADDGVDGVSDLRPLAPGLTLGVTQNFAARPADGLDVALDRYGLDFDEVVVTEGSDRVPLYEALIGGEIDVMVGYSSDPEIVDFGFAELRFDLPIATSYEAVPLTSSAVLDREPRLRDALAPLAGRLDTPRMRALTRQVQIGGRSPRGAAAAGLAELGLLERTVAEPNVRLLIAANPLEVGSRTASRVLRAVREAMPGRNVAYLGSPRPLAEIPARNARLALAPAIAHFDVTPDGVVRDDRVEAVAAVGSTLLHAIARVDGPDRLGAATAIATGPEGSASHKLISVVAANRTPAPKIVPLDDPSEEAVIATLRRGAADVAVLLAARERPEVVPDREAAEDLRFIDAADWWEGAARLELPFLRLASLASPGPAGGEEQVRTVAMQTTLVGPSPPPVSVLGRQGPGSISTVLYPLTDANVLAINEALGPHPDVVPHLRRAAALTPEIRPAPTATNPRPGDAALLIVIVGFLGFAGWLLVRPRPAGRDPAE
ncbi:MAG: hypothetical protein GVY33_14020 [Alphaproteobacteria bacterium]|jgi:glycine betaine/choline ABC-type transport system substrate-binding protein|nr:hypothetical protein [Alphaproteobacteria bacterium]